MARNVLVTGAAGGIGRATVSYLQSTGANVLEVDLHGVPLCCDLRDPDARTGLIRMVESAVDSLDAVIAAAGMLDATPSALVAVNYFGATRLLEGLRHLLAKSTSPRALVMSSISSRYPCDEAVIEACLDDDEAKALRLASVSSTNLYAATKAALARWVRRRAVTPEWGGSGILLNAIAAGMIADTGMTRPLMDAPGGAERLQRQVPSAIGRFGTPDDMARLIAFLAGQDNRYIVGQVIYADGGCDALQRGDTVW